VTLGEYLNKWLEVSVHGSVRQSTYDRDANLISNHIKPALGRIKLKNLTPTHVQSFYRNRLDAGLSTSTVHKIHTLIHKALSQPIKWQMVSRNVTEAVKSPRPAPREMHPLSANQVHRLLQAIRGERLEALYVLAVTTGMRQGELLALRWQDVDMENTTLSVRRTLTRNGGRIAIGEPKTKKSRRSIRLTSQAVETLRIPEASAKGHRDTGRQIQRPGAGLHYEHRCAHQPVQPAQTFVHPAPEEGEAPTHPLP
jgi:integrase